MNQRRFLVAGIVGTVIAALCCFTPILVVLLGAVGLSALAGKIDDVLLPVMIICAAVIVYALARRGAS
jgi:mercuric ion transport protein